MTNSIGIEREQTNASLRHFSALLLKESFNRFKGANVKVKVVHDRPDPESLSKQAEKLVQEFKDRGEIRSGDQFWIISDKDQYTADQLEVLFTWARRRSDRSLGFSVPQFEFWLLLHYENGNGVATQKDCMSRLKAADPRYQKNNLSSVQFTEAQIKAAVKRAKRFQKLPSTYSAFTHNGLDRAGFTSVHVLHARSEQTVTKGASTS